LRTNLKTKFFGLIVVLVTIILFVIATIFSTRMEVISSIGKEIEASETYSLQLEVMIASQIKRGVTPLDCQFIIQEAFSQSKFNLKYSSVLNWSGKIIAHPDVTKVDDFADYNDSQSQDFNKEISTSDIYSQLNNIEDTEHDYIIGLRPIKGTDWIITSHLDLNAYHIYMKSIYYRNVILFSIIALCLIILMVVVLRFYKLRFEKEIDEKQSIFSDGVSNLGKLNESLERYQESVLKQVLRASEITGDSESKAQNVNKESEDVTKSRILTYVRNELMSISIEDIAYIYVENTITYFIRKDGKRSTSNESLDQIYSSLDERLFFKANRQFIVAISAIDKISKYGNSQLKLVVNPECELEIIIGKNKAASFKKWLNM